MDQKANSEARKDAMAIQRGADFGATSTNLDRETLIRYEREAGARQQRLMSEKRASKIAKKNKSKK